ncbi:hypothetical protein MNB_SM-4-1424 [hydrothermal vent metagenome]|uniref:ApeI dehydratase-like domain-containing protein n=1 Tax=hydrothermal vent metagenome TaxID=652676 RepID=A0A1W1CSA4_9ZZZZ
MLLDGLYEVLNRGENEASVKLSDESHPVFKAHFPQNPILPGFVHLDIIEDVFEMEITAIKKAKYSALILPTQTLVYKRDKNRIKVFMQENEVATFSF